MLLITSTFGFIVNPLKGVRSKNLLMSTFLIPADISNISSVIIISDVSPPFLVKVTLGYDDFKNLPEPEVVLSKGTS